MLALINELKSQSTGCGRWSGFTAAVIVLLCPMLWAAESDTVRIAGSAWVGDAPTRLADQLGLFNVDRSFNEPDIEVVNHDSGLEAVRSLVSGHSQFALGATTPVAAQLLDQVGDEHEQRPGFVVLASVALSNRSHRLILRNRKNIRVPQDWDAVRIGIMFGTSSHFGWSHFATFHGLNEDNYTLVDIPINHMAEALLAGDVDGVVVWSPWERELREKIGTELLEFPLRMLYTVNWLLLADRQFAHEQPDVVKRVLRGYLAVMQIIDAEPQRARQVHADFSGVPLEEFIEISEGMIWRLTLNWSALVNLGTQMEWLARMPEFQGRVPSPSEYLYGQPLRSLAPEMVNLPDYMMLEALVDRERR